jgi:hypothetical protein
MEAHPEVEGIVTSRTSRYGRHEDLVVFVARPGPGPSDEEWHAYVGWLRRVMNDTQGMRILVLARGKGPSAEQRSYANAELGGDRVRMAVLLEDPLLLPVIKVFSWFVRSLRIFAPTQVNEALGYLGVARSEGVDALLTQLGVPLP